MWRWEMRIVPWTFAVGHAVDGGMLGLVAAGAMRELMPHASLKGSSA
jgi:hypothetical protein